MSALELVEDFLGALNMASTRDAAPSRAPFSGTLTRVAPGTVTEKLPQTSVAA